MDTCFEMYDGAYVVAALVRAAEGGAGYLRERLTTDNPCMWDQWQRTATGVSDVPDTDLPVRAAELRRTERNAAQRRYRMMQSGHDVKQMQLPL